MNGHLPWNRFAGGGDQRRSMLLSSVIMGYSWTHGYHILPEKRKKASGAFWGHFYGESMSFDGSQTLELSDLSFFKTKLSELSFYEPKAGRCGIS